MAAKNHRLDTGPVTSAGTSASPAAAPEFPSVTPACPDITPACSVPAVVLCTGTTQFCISTALRSRRIRTSGEPVAGSLNDPHQLNQGRFL